jgi:hypothetical protein
VKNALNHVVRVLAGLLPASVLAHLGLPAFAAAVFLAVLVLWMIRWVISSGERSERVIRIILARHGSSQSLAARSSAPSALASRSQRSAQRRPARKHVPRKPPP